MPKALGDNIDLGRTPPGSPAVWHVLLPNGIAFSSRSEMLFVPP